MVSPSVLAAGAAGAVALWWWTTRSRELAEEQMSQADVDAARREEATATRCVTWNIAAVNNPFEYWITHPSPEYNQLMHDAEEFLDTPGSRDVEVGAVFTEAMWAQLKQAMRDAGMSGVCTICAAFGISAKVIPAAILRRISLAPLLRRHAAVARICFVARLSFQSFHNRKRSAVTSANSSIMPPNDSYALTASRMSWRCDGVSAARRTSRRPSACVGTGTNAAGASGAGGSDRFGGPDDSGGTGGTSVGDGVAARGAGSSSAGAESRAASVGAAAGTTECSTRGDAACSSEAGAELAAVTSPHLGTSSTARVGAHSAPARSRAGSFDNRTYTSRGLPRDGVPVGFSAGSSPQHALSQHDPMDRRKASRGVRLRSV